MNIRVFAKQLHLPVQVNTHCTERPLSAWWCPVRNGDVLWWRWNSASSDMTVWNHSSNGWRNPPRLSDWIQLLDFTTLDWLLIWLDTIPSCGRLLLNLNALSIQPYKSKLHSTISLQLKRVTAAAVGLFPSPKHCSDIPDQVSQNLVDVFSRQFSKTLQSSALLAVTAVMSSSLMLQITSSL